MAKKRLLNWRKKHKSLEEYYQTEYPSEYYDIEPLELEIDPMEPKEDVEAYDEDRRFEEIYKCKSSFSYFCTKYVKILHPRDGLIPFVLFKYQKRVIKEMGKHLYNIVKKFRQGGLTTVAQIWGFWRCLFFVDQQVMFLSKTDREAIKAGKIVDRLKQYLPTWMQPNDNSKWNEHQKEVFQTGSMLMFYTPEAARGNTMNYLIVDEAAFIDRMDEHWMSMYPTLSAGGGCIVISTVYGTGNWYEEQYHLAKDGKNTFNVIDLEYTEHPDYNDPEWVKKNKANLKKKGWEREVLGIFESAGESYIPALTIKELNAIAQDIDPIKHMWPQFANEGSPEGEGSLLIWDEPIEGREYLISIDASNGEGDEGDNSCFQILDQEKLEQVGEFYSNLVKPHIFASLIKEIGYIYNHALCVVESNSWSAAVLNNLQYELYYDNLYYDSKGKAGLKITQVNRNLILEGLQDRLMNKTLKIKSKRFLKELPTFILHKGKNRVEAKKGKHDDAISAMAYGLYVRDMLHRNIPVGAEAPALIPRGNVVIDKEIRKEIIENFKNEFSRERKQIDIMKLDADIHDNILFTFRRKNDKLLREFGF